MYVIEIIPISRGISHDSLTYFTSKEVHLGAIVDVPMRNKKIKGIVIAIKKAADMKGEIKKAGFALKKVDKINSTDFFTKPFMDTVSEVADYYATSPGAILDILVPKYILGNIGKLQTTTSLKSSEKKTREKYVVQGDDDERFGTWKGLIRQEFAKKKSIFFVMPTIEDVEHIFELFEKGIEGYAFKLHGSLTPKKIVGVWNAIMEEKHPVVVIATGGFLSLPREDIETIVVESESSKAYKVSRRPFLDIRTVCEIFAKKNSSQIFFADATLRTETLWREQEGFFTQASPFKFRSLSPSEDYLIDMKTYKTQNAAFKILSDEVENVIKNTKERSQHMIILAVRRGVSPLTVCGDCQTIVVCNSCSAPVILHTTEGKTFFMCHRCGERRSTEEYCKNCGSWKLGTVGIGIDLVMEKIKAKFPEITFFKIDSDTIKNEKSAKAIMQKFKNEPGSVLVGTEMMLQYVHEKVENAAIVSLDSFFSLPDFRIQEKILQILIRMRAFTTQQFIVQTRKADEKVFEYGLKGNIIDFYKSAIEERKRFNYPPFTTLIKITLEGKKDVIVKEMDQVQNTLDPYEVEVFPAFTHTIRGSYVLHGLIRLPIEKWPDRELISKLRTLSPAVIVKVDPESLL